MAATASPSAWRPTSRRTIPAEIIDATLALIADPDITLDELMRIVPGPDFPTGGIIIGRSGIRAAFETGRGIHHHPRARRDSRKCRATAKRSSSPKCPTR